MKARRTPPADGQLLLPGIEAPLPPLPEARGGPTTDRRAPRKPAPAHALVLAVHPTDADAARIAAWSAQWHAAHGIDGLPIAPDRLHVPLHDLGEHVDLPDRTIALAIEAASRVMQAPFDVVFDGAARGAKGAFALHDAGSGTTGALRALRQRLGEVLADAGFSPRLGFEPRMTVSRVRASIAPVRIEPLRWRAESFSLVDWQGAPAEPVLLRRWPLDG